MERVMDRQERELWKKYQPLIKWASKKYSTSLKRSPYDFCTFYAAGCEIFVICIKKWRAHRYSMDNILEFGKYFKTALFRKLWQIQVMAFRQKRQAHVLSFDTDLGGKFTYGKGRIAGVRDLEIEERLEEQLICDGGFNEVFYRELVEYVASFLKGLELEIFRILVDPPAEIIAEAAIASYRKRHASLCSGNDKLFCPKITKSIIIEFLIANNGVTVTSKQYSDALKNVKKIVAETVRT